jgi:hypothetical protein
VLLLRSGVGQGILHGNLRAGGDTATNHAEMLGNVDRAAPLHLVNSDQSLVRIDQNPMAGAPGCGEHPEFLAVLGRGQSAMRTMGGQFRPGPLPSLRPKSNKIEVSVAYKLVAWILLS